MEKAKEYLQSDAPVMQIATVSDDKPWIASVYFVADSELNVYWLSWPQRRHSVEVSANAQVAATVVIKTDRPVIGVQLEGHVEGVLDAKVVRAVMELYVAKYNEGKQFYDAFVAGTNKHRMYRLRPRAVQLFDEVHFPAESPMKVL